MQCRTLFYRVSICFLLLLISLNLNLIEKLPIVLLEITGIKYLSYYIDVDLWKYSHFLINFSRYRDPCQQDGEAIQIDNEADRLTTANDEEDENATETPMFEDHNEFLHGQRSKKDRIISSKFIRKYLYVAKMQNPTLTKVSMSPFQLY